ncbi:MAG TPA: DUF748 domain-containing protein [Trinickia sp.]|nr:DUF748 domain-containing protein [Trinickia sp.]
MTSEPKAVAGTGMRGLRRLREAAQSRRTRRVAIGVLVFLALFGLVGFFAAPPLIRHVAERQLSETLERPASIERVALNPYTLRLQADRVHLGERGGAGGFVDIERLVVRLSWTSLFHLAPIVDEVKVDSPRVTVVRYDAQHFNFSDLVEKFSAPSPKPKAKPALFSVSNIAVENGRIDFDDRLLGVRHVVDQLSLGVPFIATLPSKTDIFVDPRFAARIDGSPVAIGGKTKPFAASRESEVLLKFDDLDVPRLLSYAPKKLPVTVQSGKLAGDLKLHFLMTGEVPALTVTGTTDLADARIVDEHGAPLVAARALHVAAATLEPLKGVFHFDEIRLDQPTVRVARERSGALSVQSLFAPSPAAAANAASAAVAEAASAASAVGEAAGGQAQQPPLDLSIRHFALNDGAVSLADRVPARPVALDLQHLTASLDDFSTLAATPARYTVHTALGQGGTLAATGTFGFAKKTADSKLTADALPLTVAQPYLDNAIAARITDGKLDAQLAVSADWSKTPANVRVGEGELTLNSLKVSAAGNAGEAQGAVKAVKAANAASGAAPAIALAQGRVVIKRVDAAARVAEISSVEATGLAVNATRAKDGRIDLAALAGPPQSAAPVGTQTRQAQASGRRNGGSRASAQPASSVQAQSAWHYSIDELNLKDASADIVDNSPARPATFHIAPVQLNVRNLSDDLSRALPVKLEATLNGKGALDVTGDVTPSPLGGSLNLTANRLDAAAVEPYFGDKLRASLASAFLNARGDLKLATGKSGAISASYRGGLALVDLRMLDRVTSTPLAGWSSLLVARMNARYDERGADIDIGRVTFTHFFARVLLNAQGKLNLNDVLAGESAASAPNAASAAQANASSSVAAAAPTAPSPNAPSRPLKLRIGEVVLQQGKINYTDNFIKPNYSANLVDITGTIGTMGTDTTTPAPVDVSASLAANGPIAIRGTVNPLAHKPSLDLSASAHDIQLTNLSPYSMKYAGYPITKGKLNVDLHYKLENDVLGADNHIFISQLAFGDHVQNDTATKLPVRLAISLLKNSRGEIDVNIPVSGSLSNPQFSLGQVIWSAVAHLIEKAVTAPFSLLANAFGGKDANAAEQLRYVVFSPGSAALTDDARSRIDTLTKLLAEKPEVKVGLSGRADPAIDVPALRLAHVDELVKQEKAKALKDRGQNADPSTVTVDASEYSEYLAKAYKDADFKKLRNFVGLTKSLPDDDMKRALAEHAQIGEAELRELAQKRAESVRQQLVAKIDPSRVPIDAPKLDATDIKASEPATRVDLQLQ